MNFDQSFDKLIGHEGGYDSNPADPGGETNWGISKRSYPNIDIKQLTLDQAKEIYKRDFWDKAGCDYVPEVAKFQLFDFAVNSGITPAVKTLQKIVGTTPDGVIGPKTIAAIGEIDSARFVAHFNAQRLAFMVGLGNWPQFSRGWALRIVDNLMEA